MRRPVRRFRIALLAALVAVGLIAGAVPAQAAPARAVFLQTNDAAGNQVLVYRQAGDGSVTLVDTVDTGGVGTGDGLGSQGSVTLSENGRSLLVVNAGSDSVSLFSVRGTRLRLRDVESSAGDQPISVDVSGRYAYVVNAGSDSIAGFRVGGKLTPIEGSVGSLSGSGVAPAQIEFSPNGRTLAVTEKGTNLITTFPVDRRGRASQGQSSPAAGETPFGFEFDPAGRLVVSEAFGGADSASTVSTYTVGRNGAAVLDGPVATTQTAACWIAITDDGRTVYSTNTGSDSISRFRLDHDGTLTLIDQTATGDSPTDIDLSDNGRYAYVLGAADDTVSIYRVGHDGSLRPVGVISGLPSTAVGLAAG